ncbi:MAG TPA: MAPEG family protein [Caulobacteraceae bacterium]|nr:MAPEG family protein [Caulobacteraceae bacterium]
MQTVALPVASAIAAGALIVGQMALMLGVVIIRRRAGPSLGDGGDPVLLAAVRRHGNYAENAAIFVASLALLEMLGAARPFVIGLATLFILGRILHAIGLSQTKTANIWRVAGVFATVGAGVTLGVRLVTLAVTHLG